MRHRILFGSVTFLAMMVLVTIAADATHPVTDTRVPSSAMDEALGYKAPFGDARSASPDIVEAGKKLYEGKGACHLCHGVSGKGDGPAGHMHTPHPPRDFTDCNFQKARQDGELYWIIKYGSKGTGMQRLIPGMLSEEEGWKIVAYVRTFCSAQP
jgi:mono/diheme cytochrome c family protein